MTAASLAPCLQSSGRWILERDKSKRAEPMPGRASCHQPVSWGYENPLRRQKGLIFLFCQYFLNSGSRQREVEGGEPRDTDRTKFGWDGTLASVVNTCLEARLQLRTTTEGRQGRGASRAQPVKHTRQLLIALKQ